MMPIIILRPADGAASTLAAAQQAEVQASAYALSEVAPCSWHRPDPAQFDGLLIGSANALRHAGPQLADYRGLPVHAVGSATMRAALACGLARGIVGEGGLQAVIEALPPRSMRLLRLAGREHLPLDRPPHISLETRIVYEVRPLPLPEELAEILASGAVVLLHSAASARHFSAEVSRLSLPRSRIAIAALGPRIAAVAGDGWREVRSAAMPSDVALLALSVEMCH